MKEEFSFLSNIAPEPGNLVRGLQMIQSVCGYLSDEAIRAASEYFSRPPADVEGILSFYPRFKRVRPGKFRIAVCDGSACRLKGSPQIRTWIEQELKIKPGETTPDALFSLETVTCLGCCSQAPVMSINGHVYGQLERKSVTRILKEYSTI